MYLLRRSRTESSVKKRNEPHYAAGPCFEKAGKKDQRIPKNQDIVGCVRATPSIVATTRSTPLPGM